MVWAGILLSLIFCALRGWEQRDLEKQATDITAHRAEKLQSDIWRSMEVLQSIAALHAVSGDLGAKEFHAFVQRALVRQHEIQALSWNRWCVPPIVLCSSSARWPRVRGTMNFGNSFLPASW